ncbi:MAG TPA: KTSC domain-containing protein [Allosphingosinicella sp.]|nr:KTSC domain-containing protein [Allosphingosinicella sp.]
MPSTVISGFDYRPAERELEIRFVTGRRYLYHGVPPAAFEAFRAAFSKGRHFNAHIRGRYRFTDCTPQLRCAGQDRR